jgi:hypothetical protein
LKLHSIDPVTLHFDMGRGAIRGKRDNNETVRATTHAQLADALQLNPESVDPIPIQPRKLLAKDRGRSALKRLTSRPTALPAFRLNLRERAPTWSVHAQLLEYRSVTIGKMNQERRIRGI